MVLAGIIAVLIGGLVLLYLTRPHYDEFDLSSARFFADFTADNDSSIQFSLQSLFLSKSFYLQLAVLVLLMLTLLSTQCSRAVTAEHERIGAWVLLDTSSSMLTAQQSQTNWQAAFAEIVTLQNHFESLEQELAHCFKLSTFDLERRDLTIPVGGDLNTALAGEGPRLLGTDLGLLRSTLQSTDLGETCAITHIIVISDIPAPDWLGDLSPEIPVIWRDISTQVGNVGITSVQTSSGSLSGSGQEIQVEVTAFHNAPGEITIDVLDGEGNILQSEPRTLDRPGITQIVFSPTKSGLYTIELQPGGSYAHDDTATIAIDVTQGIRVDWQLRDLPLPVFLNWKEDTREPHLRVADFPFAATDEIPTLLVGDAYGQGDGAAEIHYFDEDSPLLTDLNLDVLESLPIQGIKLTDRSPLQHVLFDTTDGVWLAAGSDPPAAYIPGLPTGMIAPSRGDDLDAVSTTLFFNAVRYLLHEQQTEPLYTLTTPENQEPEGNRISLHPGEGNTGRLPLSRREVTDIQPAITQNDEEPIWPILLALAAIVYLFERVLSTYGGPRWR